LAGLEEPFLKKIYSKVSAETAEDLVFRNNALFELGLLYFEKCDFRNASDCLSKVKTEALQFHLYDNYFRAISLLMRISSERLDFDQYKTLLGEALHVSESLAGYNRYLPKLHYNQGVAASYRKEPEASLEHFKKSQEAARQVLLTEDLSPKDRGDLQRDLFLARNGEGVALDDLRRSEEALKLFQDLYRDIQEFAQSDASEGVSTAELEATVIVHQGHAYLKLKQYSLALERFWAAHGILKLHRSWSFYYYVLLGLGMAYKATGETDRAQIFFDLIRDAVKDLELNTIKRILKKVSDETAGQTAPKLMIDRERKVVIEPQIGEVHFDRRFVLLEILYLLAGSSGKVFTKEDLVAKIWRESYNPMVHDSKVYTSISRLRKLIEPDFRHPVYVLNERDGYTFNAAILFEEVRPRLRAPAGATTVDAAVRKGENNETRI
jgi:DNA-binding winged helix-turn-helix (wHTH) protein